MKGKGTSEKVYTNMPRGKGNRQHRALKIAFEVSFMFNSSSIRQTTLKDLEKRNLSREKLLAPVVFQVVPISTVSSMVCCCSSGPGKLSYRCPRL